MKQSWKALSLCVLVLIVATGFLTVGCGGGGNSKIRFVNASPNSPTLNILIDGKSVNSGLGFGFPTSYMSVSSGSRVLEFQPVGTTNDVVKATVNIASGTNNTYILENFLSNIRGAQYVDNQTTPTTGDAQIRVINAAASVTAVDIYLVPSGTNPTSVPATLSNVQLGGTTPYITEAAGQFVVFFTQPNFPNNLYVDSGVLTFNSLQNRTIIGLSNPNGGFSSITLADLN
jgi:Domain of unknown function (DUF4397)